MIEVKVESQSVTEALRRLFSAAGNPAPVLQAIGENLVLSTKKRFETSTAPDGSKWKSNSQSTLEAFLRGKSGHFSAFSHLGSRKEGSTRTGDKKGYFKKDGTLTKRSQDILTSKKPLIGVTHSLASQISYAVSLDNLMVGSPMKYAAIQQFGGKRSQFHNLWGDIPARPFLGISDADEQMIENTVTEYFRRAFSG